MLDIDKKVFIEKSIDTLDKILETLRNLPLLKLGELKPESTALIIVDMINAFARQGCLKSPRVEALIPGIAGLLSLCKKQGIPVIAFGDCHTKDSPEFETYPEHGLAETAESEMVDELKKIGGYTLIPKNSTNGFLEEKFQTWLEEHSHLTTFIVVGDCTDICVEQFAKTLKAFFNMLNKRIRVVVPADAVDTFDLGAHYAELMNVMALFGMMGGGVEVVRTIEG